MEAIRKYSRNETVGIVLLALVVVLAYSMWGAYLLHNERTAATQGPAVATNR